MPQDAGQAMPPAWLRYLLGWLEGKKTLLTVVAAGIYLFGISVGWWPRSEEVIALFGFLGLGFLRLGVQSLRRKLP